MDRETCEILINLTETVDSILSEISNGSMGRYIYIGKSLDRIRERLNEVNKTLEQPTEEQKTLGGKDLIQIEKRKLEYLLGGCNKLLTFDATLEEIDKRFADIDKKVERIKQGEACMVAPLFNDDYYVLIVTRIIDESYGIVEVTKPGQGGIVEEENLQYLKFYRDELGREYDGK